MKYDKFWICGFFLVMVVWVLVLVNQDIDLTIPTLIMMVLVVLYLILGIFISIIYLLKVGELKRRHMQTMLRKVTGNDKCSIIIPARDEESVIRRS